MSIERKNITKRELIQALGLTILSEEDDEDPNPEVGIPVGDFDKYTELFKVFEERNFDVDLVEKYGEPGHTDPAAGILFGNWNYMDRHAGDLLEELGFELEWSDEWTSVNGKAYRTSPDSYGWVSQLHLTEDGEYLSPDDDIQTWIDEMKDSPRHALPNWITQAQLEELGWKLFEESFEIGFHPGQTDDPGKIYKVLSAREDVASVLFRISDVGQFDLRFEAYILKREVEENQDG